MLKFVAASAAEAELGALFINGKETKILRLILEEMGHPQPPTPVHCDNKTATGIANDTVKRHRSRSMEMRYVWVTDQVHREQIGYNLANWSRKFGGLLLEAPYRHTSQEGTFMVYSHPKFTEGTPTGTGTKCSERMCWNPGTWVPQIGPITQGPIIGTEYIGTLIGSPSLIYGRGFTMAIISNNIRDMFMQSIHVQQS